MTLAEALNNAVARFDAAVALITGIRDQIALQLSSTVAQVNTTIQRFESRPLQVAMYVDEVGGNDTNDGLSFASPKKSLDVLLGSIGTQGVFIFLLSDATIKRRLTLFTNISINGVQQAANAAGFTGVDRTITFLPTATNSPDPFIGSCSAGFFFTAGSWFTQNIRFHLPEVPAGIGIRPHMVSRAFVDIIMLAPTITVASAANSSALFGSFFNGRITATLSPILGSGAAGHLFDGIAAGADPNAQWSYSTNVKSA